MLVAKLNRHSINEGFPLKAYLNRPFLNRAIPPKGNLHRPCLDREIRLKVHFTGLQQARLQLDHYPVRRLFGQACKN